MIPSVCAVLFLMLSWTSSSAEAPKRNYPYRELRGTVEDFTHHRQWRSYYWREDFTMLVKDDAGTVHRVISREPTPWTDRRLGTTYPPLKVDWKQKPRVHIIGVAAVDRQPEEFYDLKLDAKKTITAFICRVEMKDKDRSEWKDYYINNWFHQWGEETDKKMLAHYANDDPHYTVYGYLSGIAAPFDAAGRELLKKYEAAYGGIIYHGRVVKAQNDIGYEVKVLHLMGRSKKAPNFTYEIFHGNQADIIKLDNKK